MSLTTPALLFPAISLLLLAYTNRFLTLAQVIRQMHAGSKDDGSADADDGSAAGREQPPPYRAPSSADKASCDASAASTARERHDCDARPSSRGVKKPLPSMCTQSSSGRNEV
ncbi:MAG: DUF2721 domain-containing protein [Thauera sp.]